MVLGSSFVIMEVQPGLFAKEREPLLRVANACPA